ncbi:MAG TPA: XdhC family protein [Chitinophagaceae bacterium]|nr:XdhC family protein [Chitinophagaceae bacterium]
MKEIKQIIAAYDKATAAGKKAALATVVTVEGSSYRRPGARMLVTEDGMLTGAISGGCLEGDALRKAQFAMIREQAVIVKYDTSDEDDLKFGVQLGCNGIIHILIEPIVAAGRDNPIELLKAAVAKRQYAVIATVFAVQHNNIQPGTCLLLTNSDVIKRNDAAGLFLDATVALQTRQSMTKQYTTDADYTAFIEVLAPEVSLLIFGAGNDAIPLVDMANILGWQVTVIDGRRQYATPQRFPSCTVAVAKPGEALANISTDERTVAILLTHNYNYDFEMLKILVPKRLPYIGVLGPKKKMLRMEEQLQEEGIIWSDELWQPVHGPSGLDIGAETSEEIALSILAEIKATLEKKEGEPLRSKSTNIHAV